MPHDNRLGPPRSLNDREGHPYGTPHTNGRPHVEIFAGDSNFVDSFGRLRVAQPINVLENKNIHNKNDHQWEEPIVGAIIEYTNLVGGPFQVAETITGGTSGTIGTVTAVDGGALTVTYIVNHDDFEVGEQISGGTSGATADITTVGTGSTITFDRNNAAVTLQVGTGASDSAIRQTHRYLQYRPGKSHFVKLTFLFGAAVNGVRRRVGYFDDDNGLFLEQDSAGVRFVRRTKTSGSVVDNKIERADWNIDKLDGTGESAFELDFTKVQFFFVDFQWQGTGRVRYGFIINGIAYTAHELNTTNQLDTVYMSTPSLPVRFEIANTQATAGTNTMKEFCTSVISEGGEALTGTSHSISVDVTSRSVTTEVPVLAIRLKNSFGGGANRKTIEFINGGVYAKTNGAHFEIKHIHDPTGITATWTDIGGGSAVEYSTDITAVTGNPAHQIEEGYVSAGQAGKGGGENIIESNKVDQHRFATQNFDSTNSEMFVIFAVSLNQPSVADVYPHITWLEND